MSDNNKITFLERLKAWASQIKSDLRVLQIAFHSKFVPWYAKAIIFLTVAYALSPIDLIPDFIPVLGLLDDLIILPLLIYVAIKLIPAETMQHCRKQAEKEEFKGKKNWVVGILIIFIWLASLAWLATRLTTNIYKEK